VGIRTTGDGNLSGKTGKALDLSHLPIVIRFSRMKVTIFAKSPPSRHASLAPLSRYEDTCSWSTCSCYIKGVLCGRRGWEGCGVSGESSAPRQVPYISHIDAPDCLENSGFALSRQAPPFSCDTPKAQNRLFIRGDPNFNCPTA
jgi:hypothetical protein